MLRVPTSKCSFRIGCFDRIVAAAASFASGRSSGVAGGFFSRFPSPIIDASRSARRASSLQRRKGAHAVIRGIHPAHREPCRSERQRGGCGAARRRVAACPAGGGRGRARSHGGAAARLRDRRARRRLLDGDRAGRRRRHPRGGGRAHEAPGCAAAGARRDTRRIGQRLRAHARRFDQSGRSVRPAVGGPRRVLRT